MRKPSVHVCVSSVLGNTALVCVRASCCIVRSSSGGMADKRAAQLRLDVFPLDSRKRYPCPINCCDKWACQGANCNTGRDIMMVRDMDHGQGRRHLGAWTSRLHQPRCLIDSRYTIILNLVSKNSAVPVSGYSGITQVSGYNTSSTAGSGTSTLLGYSRVPEPLAKFRILRMILRTLKYYSESTRTSKYFKVPVSQILKLILVGIFNTMFGLKSVFVFLVLKIHVLRYFS